MSIPQYQFNLGNADPILARNSYNAEDYYKTIDDEISKLNALKQTVRQTVPTSNSGSPIWDQIDKEVSALTKEQRSILGRDEVYVSIEQELQYIVQQELVNSVKTKVENSPRGKELLEAQLKHIRDKKNQIVEESNKEMEIFKKFQIAVQANPNLTYAEFVKSIKQ